MADDAVSLARPVVIFRYALAEELDRRVAAYAEAAGELRVRVTVHLGEDHRRGERARALRRVGPLGRKLLAVAAPARRAAVSAARGFVHAAAAQARHRRRPPARASTA